MIKSFISRIKKNPYKWFFFKAIIFFSILFIIDLAVGNILRYFYFEQESGLQYRTTYAIEKTKANLLIFGSSRANHHYHPDIFEQRLKKSYYNVGRDGMSIFYDYAILRGVLKRYTPKIIILDFTRGEFSKNSISYDRISALLPYYKNYPEMRSIIEMKSSFEKFKLLSSIYPFNSSMFTIAVGNAKFNQHRRSDIKGYIPLMKTLNSPIQIDNSSGKYDIDSFKVKTYESFIKDCITSKISLYIVCSPYFIRYNNEDYSVTIGREIAKKNGIIFFDFSMNSSFINNPKLFADFVHLNEQGANFFSNMLIDSIAKN